MEGISLFSYLILQLFTLGFFTQRSNIGSYSIESVTDTVLHPYASDVPLTFPRKFEIPGMTNPWHICFEPDGNTFYYVTGDTMEIIKYSKFVNGEWTYPKLAQFSGRYRIETPHVSPNGKKFFFTYAVSGMENIYVMDKTAEGWSEPRDLGPVVNSPAFDGCPSISLNGNLYFFSTRSGKLKIYFSEYVDGNYITPVALSENINRNNVGELFIAPDESYILFDIYTPPDSWQLHISFRRNGTWTVPQNLGRKINFSNFQKRPYVTPDQNYLFYTAKNAQYQVDFKPLLDSLKNSSE